MRGPANAAGLVAVFALLALILAPFLFLSGTVVGLATLSQGAREGLKVIFLGGLFCAAALYSLFGQVTPVAGYAVMIWGPAWLGALVLRHTRDQGTAVVLSGVIVTLYTLLFRALTDDVSIWWRTRLESFGKSLVEQGGSFLNAKELASVAVWMHPVSLIVFSGFLIGMLLFARWWQALLYNPGGFRSEFQTLTLPRLISPVAALVAIGALIQIANGVNSGVAGDLMIILVVLFAVQGLAIVHHRVNKLKLPRAWLGGLYLLLVLIPHFVGTGLAIVGVSDTFADFRGCRQRTSVS